MSRTDYPKIVYGQLTEILPVMTRKRVARFKAKIDSSGGPLACHPWRGATNGYGYGQFQGSIDYRGYVFLVHRVAWALAHHREPPARIDVSWSCEGAPLCCNWRHLVLHTALDRIHRMIGRGRARHGTGTGRPIDIAGADAALRLHSWGFSQSEIARRIGRHRTTISRWLADVTARDVDEALERWLSAARAPTAKSPANETRG